MRAKGSGQSKLAFVPQVACYAAKPAATREVAKLKQVLRARCSRACAKGSGLVRARYVDVSAPVVSKLTTRPTFSMSQSHMIDCLDGYLPQNLKFGVTCPFVCFVISKWYETLPFFIGNFVFIDLSLLLSEFAIYFGVHLADNRDMISEISLPNVFNFK